MLLRRVMQHVRTQNWIAVGLDFLIVVAGVFIGIQVSNWNEARIERANQDAILERLESDYREILVDIDEFIRLFEGVFHANSRMIEVIDTQGAAPDHPERVRRDLDLVFSGAAPPSRSATMQELISSGTMGLISDEALRSSLIELDRSMADMSVTFDALGRTWVMKEQALADKIVFGNELSEDGVLSPGEVSRYDLAAMRSDPRIVAHLSFRRRNVAFLLQQIYAQRVAVEAVLDQLERHR